MSIVSGYGLKDWVIEVRFPARQEDFSSNFWDSHVLLSNGYRGSFPGCKALTERDADYSPPYSAEIVNE
jgi:hypothetical protein